MHVIFSNKIAEVMVCMARPQNHSTYYIFYVCCNSRMHIPYVCVCVYLYTGYI